MAFVANRAMMAAVYPHLVHKRWVGVRRYRSSLEHAKHKGALDRAPGATPWDPCNNVA